MFKILCQLFIALTGSSLPEEIYDDKLFYLLQGKRSKRYMIVKELNEFSQQTPHQLVVTGWPNKLLFKLEKILTGEQFTSVFHTSFECYQNNIMGDCLPSFRKIYSQVDINGLIKVILYFDNEKKMNTSKNLINIHGYNHKNNYSLRAVDISDKSKCCKCHKFMPLKIGSELTNLECVKCNMKTNSELV